MPAWFPSCSVWRSSAWGLVLQEVSIELGGAMGITLLGSILAGIYSAILVLPKGVVLPSTVREGIDQALVVAQSLPDDVAPLLTRAAHEAFDGAYFTALAVDAALLIAVALMAWRARAIPHVQLAGQAGAIVHRSGLSERWQTIKGNPYNTR